MYVCMYIYIYIYIQILAAPEGYASHAILVVILRWSQVRIHGIIISIYPCIYVCMYVCMCVYIYIYICTYIYIYM